MKKVVKFGGSSLASAEQFKKVGAIINADESRVYVIPSAPGKRNSSDTKVTDMLLHVYKTASEGKDICAEMEAIKARYNEIIEGLGLESFSLDADFEEIANSLRTEPEKDYTASRGEYLNGKIMAEYIGATFIDSAEVIFFNEEGKLNTYKTEKTLAARLAECKKAVVPGFYGLGKNGKVKTFSRGGSDVTGSIVAQAAKADVYENWTDVSGVLITDPRIVSNPEPINFITYRELRELSYMGASVLHEDAIFPVRQCGIPINLRNTNSPADEGTWIVESTAQKPPHVITGIAGKKNFCTVFITKAMMNSEIGFCRKVLQAFEENEIPVEHVPSGIDTMTVVVHEDEFMCKEQKVLSAINRLAAPDSIEIEAGLALVAVVGRGMKSASGTAGKLFSALAKEGINVKMIDQGSSELNIIVGIKNEDFEPAIKAVYKEFVLD